RTRAVGSRGLGVVGYGARSGLVGGVLFGFVWGVVGVMPAVARLGGADGGVAGGVVDLLIAQGIGVSYALRFRGRGDDLVSGGVLFGFVWGVVDVLPPVAKLVGADGDVAGCVVHLLIAQGIGVSYTLLLRGRGYALVSGVGWGLSYGFFWWVFGGLTLMPAVL